MELNSIHQGTIEVSWELKDEDGIVVSVSLDEKTKRLPYEYRQRIVQQVREMVMISRRRRM